MIAPIDGWTLAHALAGVLTQRLGVKRPLAYLAPVLWEVYQVFFHYGPLGEGWGLVWLNSAVDVLAFLALFEVVGRLGPGERWQRGRLTDGSRAVALYLFLTVGIAWLFWDDLFRMRLAAGMPSPHVPLIAGALAPVAAALLVRTWARGRLSFRSAGITSNASAFPRPRRHV